MTTNLCLAANAAGLFLIAWQLRQIRLGYFEPSVLERWFQALFRERQRLAAAKHRRETRGPKDI